MKYIGPHVSISGGLYNAPLFAKEINASAFAMFTKNQRQWKAPVISDEERKKFKDELKNANIMPEHVLPHDSYLINLGNPEPEKRENAYNAFLHEVERVESLGLKLLNFHPGSHLNEISEEESLNYIADAMNKTIANTNSALLIIENTAGQGSNLGFKFEHLSYLIKKIDNKNRVGVCLDTCHTFSAGYDISTGEKFEKVMMEFDKVVGLKYLRAMHINDSKVPFASKKDRHESIGKGTLGIEPFKWLMKSSIFEDIPLILETPNSDIWADEIKLLYSFC